MEKKRLLPYGIADFVSVRTQNFYYVDKTMFIPEIEKSRYVFLLRPRRFGKSLFLNTLEAYYNLYYKDRFEEIFKGTWIYDNPTEYRGKYLTLCFNFSGGMYEKGKYQETFKEQCIGGIKGFISRYKELLTKEVIEEIENASDVANKIQVLCRYLSSIDKKLYIFIDEYDNFANDLLTEFGTDEYSKMVHEGGFFKRFFKTLKQITTENQSALERMFITGVSPITMDDIGSGFNIGANVSLYATTNTIFGFTEKEVCEMLDYYEIDKDKVLPIMKEWYDNYLFSSRAEQSVFNTDAVLYFVKEYQTCNGIPEFLVDDNLKTDYGKLRKLVIQDKKLNGNFNILTGIINTGGIASDIVKSFPYDLMAKPQNYVSLLYYLGMITHSGTNIGNEPFLKIPNETIKKIFFEYIVAVIEGSHDFTIDVYRFSKMLTAMAYQGEFKPLFHFIADEISKNTSVRDFINESDNEQVVKLFYLKDLILFDTYIVYSESENNKGFADLLLKPFIAKYKDIKYAYLLEIKYIKRSTKKKALKAEIAMKVEQAEEQLKKYAIDDKVKKALHTEPYGEVILKKVAIVFYGWEVVYIDAIR